MMLLLKNTIGPIVKRIKRYSCEKYKGPDNASLIISNHTADLDPALVSLGFTRHAYFLASEHALRGGLGPKLLSSLFAPVPFNKAKADISSVKETIRRLKAGASVCLFAEGDRSFSGVTCPVAISTAKLVKTSGADLITFRLEGGYFATPRWAKINRKGPVSGKIVNTYSAATLKTMSAEEVLKIIERDIHEDAYERQKDAPKRYVGEDLAESLETALYLCPGCRKIGTLKSDGDRFFCGCGLDSRYTETGFLEGDALPFSNITEWYRWQEAELPKVVSDSGDKPICTDENQQLFEVNPAKGTTLIGEGVMSIDRQTLRCAGKSFELTDITRVAIVGQMDLIFSDKSGVTYTVLSHFPRSALKYREIFKVLTIRH